jgi:hypothetical protein
VAKSAPKNAEIIICHIVLFLSFVTSRGAILSYCDGWLYRFLSAIHLTIARSIAAPIEACIEHTMQMMDRYNRLFLRTLRLLRVLRWYSTPITINNPGQVNIAVDGGKQLNTVKRVEERAERLRSPLDI